MKVHTMFVIGKRDMEANAVSVRVHGKGNLGAKPRGEVIASDESMTRSLDRLVLRCDCAGGARVTGTEPPSFRNPGAVRRPNAGADKTAPT